MRVNYRLILDGCGRDRYGDHSEGRICFFSTGNPDGPDGHGLAPGAAGLSEIESADDFVLTQETKIDWASFTGLVTGTSPPSFGNVVVEIYRVFPDDSNVGRTSGPCPPSQRIRSPRGRTRRRTSRSNRETSVSTDVDLHDIAPLEHLHRP